MSVHTVFGDILVRQPPLGGQVAGVAGVQEGVVAGVGQEGLKGEGDYGEDAGEEGEDYQDDGDDYPARLAQVDLGYLSGFAGDGGVVFAALQAELVEQHDCHSENHHDDGQYAGLARVLGVHRHVFCRERGKVQVVRHGIAAHGAAEHQEYGGEYGRLDHGEGDAEHYLPLGRVQYGGRLFQVGVHVAENAADERAHSAGPARSHTGTVPHTTRQASVCPASRPAGRSTYR